MASSPAYSWIFLLTLFNYEIITASLIPFSFEGLLELGIEFLLNGGNNENDAAETENDMIQEISSKIDNIEKAIKMSETTIINEIGYLIQYHQAIHDYSDDIDYIRGQYELFKLYADDIDVDTLQDFAKSSLTHGDNGLSHRLNHLVKLVSPISSRDTGLLELIVEPEKTEEEAVKRCGKGTSLQQDIYRMYEEILIYIIKGYAMKSAAYDILKKHSSRKYKREKKITLKFYEKSMRSIKKSAVSAMRSASRDIRSCDAQIHESGTTHIDLKWLFNSIVLSEVFLNEAGTCSATCENYVNTGFYPYIDLQAVDQCPGRLYQCTNQYASYYCLPSEGSSRRYDAIYTNSRLVKNCTQWGRFLSKFQLINNWGFNRCDWCTCYCDSYNWPDTVRTFSLRPVQSNRRENEIITGLRFVEKNQVIYIQIQKGKLEANGSIISNVEWQSIDEFDIKSPSTPSEDYFTINYDKKSVNLDTLFSPVGQVMTGVKLSDQQFHLGLEIMTHSFDYKLGTLADENGVWISNNQFFRKEIEIEEPDIPTLTAENIVNTEHNTYINFRMTDLDKDYGQTAVPFIDAQPVFTNPPQSLSGAGLYYRGQTGYGGFIALKLVTHDYSSLIDQQMHSEQDESQLSSNENSEKIEQSEKMKSQFQSPENKKSKDRKNKPAKPASKSRRSRKGKKSG